MTFDRIKRRWRALFRRDEVERELDAELRFHLEQETAQNLRSGMDQEEARYAAMRSFGGIEQSKEECRDARGVRLIEEFWRDLRYGVRALRKNRSFTTIAVLTLALGIGANTAIFSVVNGVLLRPLPYPDSNELVWLSERSPSFPSVSIAYPNFVDWQTQQHVFASVGVYRPCSFSLTNAGEAVRLQGVNVTSGVFAALRVAPVIGREFREDEDRPGGPATVVLGYALWQSRFGGNPDILNQTITLDGIPQTVIGVMPAGFDFPGSVDIWRSMGPLIADGNFHFDDRGHHSGFFGVARLQQDVTLLQAASAMDAVAKGLAEAYPATNRDQSVRIDPLIDNYVSGVRRAMWTLLGAVSLVLLIACANIANLLLTRATARQKEIALRAALGARQSRIVRQLLSESLLLALIGAGAGLLLARLALPMILLIGRDSIPRPEAVSLDASVLFFAFFLAVITGVLFGVVPAWQASRVDLQVTLRKTSQGTTAKRALVREGLVVTEFALTLLLLVGAGLLLRSFHRLQQVNPGFAGERVLSFRFDLPGRKYSSAERQSQFYQELMQKIRALPGVQSVGATSRIPLDPTDSWQTNFSIEGRPTPPEGDQPTADLSVVSDDYFQTIGIPLIRGRSFNTADDRSHLQGRDLEKVDGGQRWMAGLTKTIVDEQFAKHYWPNSDPLGQRIKLPWGPSAPTLEVVGVVGRVNLDHLGDPGRFPQLYLPFQQGPREGMAVVVRTTLEPQALIGSVRQQVAALDSQQPIYNVRTLSEIRDQSIAPARLNFALLGNFAFLAVVLAAVGVYGLLSQQVLQRTQEIGIRIALGAQLKNVLGLILKDGMKLALIGAAIGLVAAFGLSRLLATLLFEVKPNDVLTYALVAIGLQLVALVACYIPARRATKVDPLVALRFE